MYPELHCQSAFSFLEGASNPEDLAAAAAAAGLSTVALVDRMGVYGAPRFYKACGELGIRPLVGAEVALAGNSRVALLCASQQGYRNLCHLLTEAAAGKPKGEGRATMAQLSARAEGLYCLAREGDLEELRGVFGERLRVELLRHGLRAQERENRELIKEARRLGVPFIATNGVRYARRQDKDLADVFACLRLKTTLDAAGMRLAGSRERYLKSPRQMEALFRDLPEALKGAEALAERLQFTLKDLGYRFPVYQVPEGATLDSELRRLTMIGSHRRYGPLTEGQRNQIEHELETISKLDLAGYFLVVHDIVDWCRREGIMVQGRGSAANSAVCYCLGITAVDPIKMELLFERFLSEERGEWPDIDLDLPSGEQRERVIQYVYRKYGAHAAAMTANVITYRPKSAIREAAKAFGYSPAQVDRLAKRLGNIDLHEVREQPKMIFAETLEAGLDPEQPRVKRLLRVWLSMLNLPRHLGQHSGGMIVAGGRLDEVVPIEPASMPGRSVIQWDKDDCADMGLIKIDLLGLGMLAALEEALPMIKAHEGVDVDLAKLPPDDPAVFKMLNEADTVGLFQLESRAQMASLPRHAPARFYDIVVQVAIIRPGPIVGGMVHPFFDRRRGRAPVEYPHSSLEPILKRTLGVPLFQEQVLKMAMVVAGFTGGEAEELRRAMGFKRSVERMDSIEKRLRAGMAKNGVEPAGQDQIVKLITSFALYGFPESHAASFALIAYASAYLKVHHAAAFYASLLNAWPMGFYHPATLVKDAQRRGVTVLPIDVNYSDWKCTWENGGVRLGLRFIKGLKKSTGERLAAGRPYEHIKSLGLSEADSALVADAGALASLGLTRREAAWQALLNDGPLFENETDDESPLAEMTPKEETLADYRTAQLTAGPHLLAHYRAELSAQGAATAVELRALPDGSIVRFGGAVVVRQRPETAKGFVFLTLEDETGMAQAIVHPKLFRADRALIVGATGLLVEGILQRQDGALSVKAARIFPLNAPAAPSHDFR